MGFAAIMISILLSEVVATNVSNSSTELEALVDFGWPHHINSTAHHCEWSGITCDDAGRVAEISLQVQACINGGWCYALHQLDLLAFPSLTRIDLTSCGLFGVIPPQIAHLSNLTYLNPSHNQLYSELPLSLTFSLNYRC